METDKELDATGGLEEGTSTGEANSTTQPQSNRQTLNWQDDPEYRRQQSKRDAELAQAQRMAWEASQRAQAIEQQLINQQMQTLEGEDRVIYQNQLLQKQLAEVQRQRDLDAFALARARDLQDIVSATGVPLEDIENTANVHEAWKVANAYAAKQKRAPTREEEIARQADNTVDIGGGKSKTTSQSLQDRYDRHRKAYNIREQLEIMAEADSKGITLNEW